MLLIFVLLPLRSRAADYERTFDGKLLVELEGTLSAFATAEHALRGRPHDLATAPRVERMFEAELATQARRLSGAPPGTRRRWVLVSPAPGSSALEPSVAREANPWDTAHDIVDGRASTPYRGLSSTLPLSPDIRVITVEPDVSYVDRKLDEEMRRRRAALETASCQRPSAPGKLTVCSKQSAHWPFPGRFAWYLEDGFSQLARARDSVPEAPDAERVTVAHLDTGYDPDANGTNPPHFDTEHSYDFTRDPINGLPVKGGADTGDHGFPIENRGHGTGTLGILAAGEVEVEGDGLPVFNGRLGGVPQAHIVEYRISGTVANLRTGPMAWAIGFAADSGVDVISMSMGAVPSNALVTAVNHAYENGTATVAAAGNFFVVPIIGTHSPTLTVPPAYFSRVMSVTGATADDRSYSKAPCILSLLHGDLGSWAMRGSYGPRFAMQEAVAAYTPNIPWIEFSGDRAAPGLVGLDGEGTSAATPQVAAAVALWLQKNRHAFSAADWRSWRKVQAAFDAVRASAKPSARSPEYRDTYFGAGILQAAAALEESIPEDLAPRPEATIGFAWVDAVLSTVSPADTGPDKLAASEPEQMRLHREMFKTELAQLVFASERLQGLLGDRHPDDLGDDRALLRRFLAAVREDRDCSQRLRAAIDRALAEAFDN